MPMAWVTRAPSQSPSERKVSLHLFHAKENMAVLMLWQQRSKKRWICLFPADVNPTGQGVDHRQVQRELGEVAVQLQDPSMLTTASIRVSWTVSGPLLKSRKGLLEGSVRIGELEMDSFIWSPSIFSFIFLNFPFVSLNLSRLTVSLSSSRATVSSTDPVGDPGSSRTSTHLPNAARSSPTCSKELSMK